MRGLSSSYQRLWCSHSSARVQGVLSKKTRSTSANTGLGAKAWNTVMLVRSLAASVVPMICDMLTPSCWSRARLASCSRIPSSGWVM